MKVRKAIAISAERKPLEKVINFYVTIEEIEAELKE